VCIIPVAMPKDFTATREAYQRFAQVLAELEACKRLFESAGEPLPEQLKEFFGTSRSNGRGLYANLNIPQPHRPRPNAAEDDWISIETKDVMATNIVLAILRKSNRPMKARDVIEAAERVNPNVTRGAINNIGTRLGGTLITRTDEGWTLNDPAKGGIISEGYLWGPPELFEVQEKAAHRREAILHILGHFPSGLQIVQLVEQLRGCSWMKAPASKDLLKADMEILQTEDKVRRISNSKKWVREMERG
jgi:hypothetical protein